MVDDGFEEKSLKRLNRYMNMGLEQYQKEIDDRTTWEGTNSYEPLYKTLDLSRLNEKESKAAAKYDLQN